MTNDEIRTPRATTGCQGDGGLDTFREVFGREILGIEIDPLDGHPLDIDLTLRSLPGFAMGSGTLSPMRTRHTPGLRDNDDLILLVLQSGVSEVSQHGRVATINEGEAIQLPNHILGEGVLYLFGACGVFFGDGRGGLGVTDCSSWLLAPR